MINISRTATLTPYLLAVFEDGRRHPAVIILPGGGYVYTTPHEAAPVAAMFNTVDCQSFVLDYTTYTKDPQVTNDMMLEEVKQSLELLKKNADQWHIDTSRLYLCGFSAGGHLAALASNEYPDEIDRVILGYAALDLKGHTIQRGNLSEVAKLFARKPIDSVSAKTPRTFLWHTYEDTQVPVASSYEYLHKLVENGVACEAHIYQKGKHGMSLASRASAKSPDEIDHHLVSWVQLTGEWIYQ